MGILDQVKIGKHKSDKCVTCAGRGKWTENVTTTENGIEMQSTEIFRCETCNGTGISPDAGADWDIGGSSLGDD